MQTPTVSRILEDTTVNSGAMMSLRRPILSVLGLFVLGLAIRLAATQFLGGLNRPLEGDEWAYAPLAESLAAGRGFVNPDGSPNTTRLPAVPFLLSLVYRFSGPDIVAARVFMCFLGSLLIPVCFLLGREAYDQRTGLVAAVAAVFMPSWIYCSGAILTDLLAAAAVGLMVWALIRGAKRQSMPLVGAGAVFWGLSALVRATSLAFVPAVVLWLLLVLTTWRARLIAVGLSLVILMAITSPWSARNARVFGRSAGLSSQGGLALWCGNNPAATGILNSDFAYYQQQLPKEFPESAYPDALARSEACKAAARQFIVENPARFARLAAVRLWELWKIYSPRAGTVQNVAMIVSFGPVLLLFVVQAIRTGWRIGPEMLMILIIGCQTLVHMVYTSIVRYRMPVEPLVLVMAAGGLVWFVTRFAGQPAAVAEETRA